MSTTTGPTHKVVNLARYWWEENGRRAAFESSRPGYGVIEVETGRAFSSDGVAPSAWRTKAAADIHAQYPDASPRRVQVRTS